MTPLSIARPHTSVIANGVQRDKAGRLHNVDLVKGFLVLLVIVGHAITGEMHDNLLKYVTVIFRMPLLIGLSGYMLNYEKLQTFTLPLVFKKYQTRLIIPWVIAVFFFTIFININKLHSFTIRAFAETLIKGFVFPFSHLWFIVGLLSWIVFTWMLAKCHVKITRVVFIAACLSPVLLLFHMGFLQATHPVAKFIIYTIRPFYYFFFILGIYLKSTVTNRYSAAWFRPVAIVLIAVLLLLFYAFNPYLYALLTIVFDTLLLMLILDSIRCEKLSSSKILEWAGKNSLAIYLWHPIPILILASVVGRDKPVVFYIVTFVTEILLLYGIFWLSKIPFIRSYFFGVRLLKND